MTVIKIRQAITYYNYNNTVILTQVNYEISELNEQ